MRRGRILAAVLLAVAFAVPAVWQAHAQDPTYDYRTGDPEMAKAVAAARGSLPRFREDFQARRGERFVVKVAIPVKGVDAREHIWMSLDAIEGDVFVGRLANEPRRLAPLVKGSPYRAADAMISDWGYVRGGLMHGNYTTRLMLKRLPAREAEALRQALSPEP
uniref:DUF2314 domain-containing protein n=1 Tax=Bosea sp. NBC_00436 TaxID=2969620 RepID=A0A9E7ZQS0_9HYPH